MAEDSGGSSPERGRHTHRTGRAVEKSTNHDRSRSPRGRSPICPGSDDAVELVPAAHSSTTLPEDWSSSTEVYSGTQGAGHEEQSQDMGDPFTLVTYKKNRSRGIPVLFKPSLPEKSFWNVNPNVVAKTIRSAAQESILHHRINRDGSMCVFVQSEGAVANLMSLQVVAGIAVMVTIPTSYVKNMAKVYDVPLEYTDEALASYLEDDGVIAARRQVRHIFHEDGSEEYIPLKNVILTFQSNKKLPLEINLGFATHKVHEYVEGPVQCYRCQRFGHLARSCRWSPRCKFCSGPHTLTECTARRQPKCANCDGPHAASHSLCPRKRSATRRFQASVLNDLRCPSATPTKTGAQSPASHPARSSTPRPVPSCGSGRQRRPSKTVHPPLHATFGKVNHQARARQASTVQQYGPLPSVPQPVLRADSPPRVTYADAVRGSLKSPGPQPATSRRLKRPFTQPSSDSSAILPVVLAALKAIVACYPGAGYLPEVRALLAVDNLFANGANI